MGKGQGWKQEKKDRSVPVPLSWPLKVSAATDVLSAVHRQNPVSARKWREKETQNADLLELEKQHWKGRRSMGNMSNIGRIRSQ